MWDCNEPIFFPLVRNNWRASLVPAAAVIPAPIAYINVVAVKKLVVGFLQECQCPTTFVCSGAPASFGYLRSAFTCRRLAPNIYLEKIRVFQAGLSGIH